MHKLETNRQRYLKRIRTDSIKLNRYSKRYNIGRFDILGSIAQKDVNYQQGCANLARQGIQIERLQATFWRRMMYVE